MDTQPATIIGIFVSAQRGTPMQALDRSEVVADWGLRDDRKARAGSRRQVYLLDEATLRSVDVQPGELRENLTIRGLDVNTLQPGQRLRIGGTLLEVTMPCTVCGELDDFRPGLKEALRDRRGVLTRVLETGSVQRGDAVTLE
jgi:MOSC domain-containing protein YiiM